MNKDYERQKRAIKARVTRNMEKLPLLYDECDECGSLDDLKILYINRINQFTETTLVSKVHSGWGWDRLKTYVKEHDLLCGDCRKEWRNSVRV